MRAALALAILAGGCVEPEHVELPWIAAADIPGELAPELGPGIAGPPAPLDHLRIVTWNLELAPDPERSARSPVLVDADVILVQEIDAYPDEGASRTARLAAALGPAWTWFYAPERRSGDGTHGNAILSRLPIGAPEVMHLPHIAMSYGAEQRIAQRAQIDLGGGAALAFVDVHLDTRVNAVERIRQLDPAVASEPDRVVVGGDFNTLPWAWVDNAVPLVGTEAVVGQDQAQILDSYAAALGFATPISHDADTHVFPVDMRLDAIYPRGFAVTASGIGEDSAGSDHLPVWIELAL